MSLIIERGSRTKSAVGTPYAALYGQPEFKKSFPLSPHFSKKSLSNEETKTVKG